MLDLAGMVRPDAVDQQVVREGPWDAVHCSNQMGPGVKQEGHKRHAQGASLRYAAGVEVGLPQATSNRIVEEA